MILSGTKAEAGEGRPISHWRCESDWSAHGVYPRYDPTCISGTVSDWLQSEISADYKRLSEKINSLNLSASFENYRIFLQFQLQFYCLIDPLYTDPVIRPILFGLPDFGRTATIRKDLVDLGMGHVSTPSSKFGLPGGLIQRIGWLFVAEMMRMKSADLLSLVGRLNLDKNYGALHLATLAGDSARQWAIFTTDLNKFGMSAMETERLYSGARSALAFAFTQATVALGANSQLALAAET